MTALEMSAEFDILYNNIMSNQAPGLTDYEKSVFLTKAQEEVVKNYLNPKGNKYQEGFEDSPKRQEDLNKLILTTSTVISSSNNTILSYFGTGAAECTLSIDSLSILNEIVKTDAGKYLQLIPIDYTEYKRLTSKPYKYPVKNKAWKLVVGTNSIFIPGPSDTITNYIATYIQVPRPIIISNLTGSLNIRGEKVTNDCALNPEIHPEIVQRAVELAKIAYLGNEKDLISMGQRSE